MTLLNPQTVARTNADYIMNHIYLTFLNSGRNYQNKIQENRSWKGANVESCIYKAACHVSDKVKQIRYA